MVPGGPSSRFSDQAIPTPTPKLPDKPTNVNPVPQDQSSSELEAKLEYAIAYGTSNDIEYWLSRGAHFTPQCLVQTTYNAIEGMKINDAMYTENIKLIREIIKTGISVNSRASRPLRLPHCEVDNPLSVAVCSLNQKMISILLSKKADPNLLNRETQSQFLVALYGRVFLIGGPPELDKNNDDLLSPVIDQLMAAGGNINFQDEEGKTVLIIATEWNKEGIVELLLGKGAKKEIVDKGGHDARYYAENNNNTQLARMLTP
jgi:hypothetical protein